MLDRLASDGKLPIYFPLVDSLLYGDDQWLLECRQWEDLSPLWFPGCLSLDEIPIEPLDVKSCLDEIDQMIVGFLCGVIDDEQSDFSPCSWDGFFVLQLRVGLTLLIGVTLLLKAV
jgi:hypothetical protein